MNDQTISADFPFASKYLDVLGSKMHYIDEGAGDPILFLHGNPTSSYLWRNVIPYLVPHARCIAPDLIGMGKSDKPSVAYRFFDHVTYLEEFIKKMNLKNITLVVHDWGSGLGFHYASRNESNVKALAFMEALLRTVSWSDFPKDFKIGFKLMRTPVLGWTMLSIANGFIKKVLPQATVRALTEDEMAYYAEPYKTVGSRKPIRQWPLEIPIDGKPSDVHEVITSYNRWLQTTEIPKLLLFAQPGGLITKKGVAWCEENLKNLTAKKVGKGIHYIQEDNPHTIGLELASWYSTLHSDAAADSEPAPDSEQASAVGSSGEATADENGIS